MARAAFSFWELGNTLGETWSLMLQSLLPFSVAHSRYIKKKKKKSVVNELARGVFKLRSDGCTHVTKAAIFS